LMWQIFPWIVPNLFEAIKLVEERSTSSTNFGCSW
jgi:hypothetical protein